MNITTMLTAFALAFTISCGGSQSPTETSNYPGSETSSQVQEQVAEQMEPKDIVTTAIGSGKFTTLVTALKSADLVSTLQGEGPFTVFAPTDAAFAKLPEGTLEALLKNKEELTAILTYHVVSGKVTASDVAGLSSAETLLGKPIAIDTSDGVRINDAKVVTADIMASNGVVHAIDTVLLPK